MKFVCVPCDEPMKIRETLGPSEGSLTVTFECPTCGHPVAMLTNPMETQIVRSLDVAIGSGPGSRDPMGFVRSALVVKRDEGSAAAQEHLPGTACPFSSVANAAFERASEPAAPLWTEEAVRRLDNIPGFARSWARSGIEQYARQRGYDRITPEVMDEVREQFGM
jgi:hypothetical protein